MPRQKGAVDAMSLCTEYRTTSDLSIPADDRPVGSGQVPAGVSFPLRGWTELSKPAMASHAAFLSRALDSRFPRRASRACVSSGLPALDRALGGGFATAAVHEFLAPLEGAPGRTVALLVAARAARGLWTDGDPLAIGVSGGSSAAADDSPRTGENPAGGRAIRQRGFPQRPDPPGPGMHAAFGRPTDSPPRSQPGRRGWILYLDSDGDFYPPAAERLGIPLDRLLIVRPQRYVDALWTCEQALRCSAVAVVVATFRRLDAYASRRLQLAAEAGGGLGLLIRPETHPGPTFAATRVRLDPATGRGPEPARHSREETGPEAAPTESLRRGSNALVWGGPEARHVLVSVLKVRERSPVQPFVMELSDEACALPAYALPGDGSGAPPAAARSAGSMERAAG